jgi:hypothetical protein
MVFTCILLQLPDWWPDRNQTKLSFLVKKKVLYTFLLYEPLVMITSEWICGPNLVLLIQQRATHDICVSMTCNISLPPSDVKHDQIWLNLLLNSRCSQIKFAITLFITVHYRKKSVWPLQGLPSPIVSFSCKKLGVLNG